MFGFHTSKVHLKNRIFQQYVNRPLRCHLPLRTTNIVCGCNIHTKVLQYVKKVLLSKFSLIKSTFLLLQLSNHIWSSCGKPSLLLIIYNNWVHTAPGTHRSLINHLPTLHFFTTAIFTNILKSKSITLFILYLILLINMVAPRRCIAINAVSNICNAKFL